MEVRHFVLLVFEPWASPLSINLVVENLTVLSDFPKVLFGLARAIT